MRKQWCSCNWIRSLIHETQAFCSWKQTHNFCLRSSPFIGEGTLTGKESLELFYTQTLLVFFVVGTSFDTQSFLSKRFMSFFFHLPFLAHISCKKVSWQKHFVLKGVAEFSVNVKLDWNCEKNCEKQSDSKVWVAKKLSRWPSSRDFIWEVSWHRLEKKLDKKVTDAAFMSMKNCVLSFLLKKLWK